MVAVDIKKTKNQVSNILPNVCFVVTEFFKGSVAHPYTCIGYKNVDLSQ